MHAGPLITVIAVCYNHERFVEECLESIRVQTHHGFQLLVVDDGSHDRSKHLIRDWIARHRITCTFVDHPTNRGLLPTLNEVLALARGKYVAKVSTDDVWLPDKLERQLARMESLPQDVAVLYGDAYRIDEASSRLPQTFLGGCGIDAPPSGDVTSALIRGNFIPSLTTLVRRDALLSVGGYDERLNYEDWDMWLRLALRYRFASLGEINACYRIVGNSMVRTVARWDRPQTLLSNVLIMGKVAESEFASANLRRHALSSMEHFAKQLVRRCDRRAIPAALLLLRARARLSAPPLRRCLGH